MTKRFVPVLVSTAGLLGVLAAAPAHADLKVTWHMTMDSPMMKNMPPQAKAMVDNMMNPMTIYSSGKKTRTDTPMMGFIIDTANDKSIMVNKFAKTYYVSKFDPNKSQMPIPGGGPMRGAKPSDVNLDDTGKVKTILGHKCHEFIVTGKVAQDEGPNMSFKDDMWVATDLAPMGAGSMPFGNFGSVANKIAGFPLQMNMSIKGGQADGTTITFETTDLSTDTLPASTFDVPEGYTQSDNPGFGGPGMMGRPGMPPSGGDDQ
jgi:hypothetical protein